MQTSDKVKFTDRKKPKFKKPISATKYSDTVINQDTSKCRFQIGQKVRAWGETHIISDIDVEKSGNTFYQSSKTGQWFQELELSKVES